MLKLCVSVKKTVYEYDSPCVYGMNIKKERINQQTKTQNISEVVFFSFLVSEHELKNMFAALFYRLKLPHFLQKKRKANERQRCWVKNMHCIHIACISLLRPFFKCVQWKKIVGWLMLLWTVERIERTSTYTRHNVQ